MNRQKLIRVFRYGGRYIAFDGHTFAIVETDRLGARILSLFNTHPFERVAQILEEQNESRDEIKARYDLVKDLYEKNVFSDSDEECPEAPVFKRLVVLLTAQCNMRCRYCFEGDQQSSPPPCTMMSRNTADRCVHYLFDHSRSEEVHINLYGGEPLLNFDTLVHLVNEGKRVARERRRSIGFTLLTNGTLITEEIAASIASNEIITQISIDGDKRAHDANRIYSNGKGSYEDVMRGIGLLKKHGVTFTTMSVVSKQAAQEFSWFARLQTLSKCRSGISAAATKNSSIAPTAAECGKFLRAYRKYVERNLNAKEDSDMPDEVAGLSNQIICGSKTFFGCGGGLEELTVAPDGEIYLCERLSAPTGVNICDDEPPSTVWRSFIKDVLNDKCKGCWAKYLCGGGCAHTAEVIKDDRRARVPFDCAKQKIEARTAVVAAYNKINQGKGGIQ